MSTRHSSAGCCADDTNQHRRSSLFQRNLDCLRALREVMEVFMGAGWPSARNLSHRLDEIPRVVVRWWQERTVSVVLSSFVMRRRLFLLVRRFCIPFRGEDGRQGRAGNMRCMYLYGVERWDKQCRWNRRTAGHSRVTEKHYSTAGQGRAGDRHPVPMGQGDESRHRNQQGNPNTRTGIRLRFSRLAEIVSYGKLPPLERSLSRQRRTTRRDSRY